MILKFGWRGEKVMHTCAYLCYHKSPLSGRLIDLYNKCPPPFFLFIFSLWHCAAMMRGSPHSFQRLSTHWRENTGKSILGGFLLQDREEKKHQSLRLFFSAQVILKKIFKILSKHYKLEKKKKDGFLPFYTYKYIFTFYTTG